MAYGFKTDTGRNKQSSPGIINPDKLVVGQLAQQVQRLDGLLKEQRKEDGWANALVGLSKGQDKSMATEFGDFEFMDRNQLSRMYVGDGIGRKIIDAPANDMTREWIGIKMEDKGEAEAMADVLGKLKAQQFFNEAIKWQRLFGGSVIVIGAMDGNYLDTPLDIPKASGIEWLKVVDMWDIDLPSSVWERDPTKATYGQITQYLTQFRVSGTGRVDRLLVHNSRILPFFGENIPKSLVMGDQRTRYWGASVLQAIWKQLANVGGSFQAVVNLIYEFVIGKYIFPNLQDILANGGEAALTTRMEIINMSKSIINGVMLGEGEDYKRDSITATGLPELIDRIMMLLAGCANIPVSRLFGRSAAGLNSTGEGDENVYYDTIRSDQTSKLRPPLMQLLTMISKINKFKSVPVFEFKPLKQMSAKEQAETEGIEATAEYTRAQADQIYLMNGVKTAEDVMEEREFSPEAPAKSEGAQKVAENILGEQQATPGTPAAPGGAPKTMQSTPGTQIL